MKVLIVHNAGASALPSGELSVVEAQSEALRSMGIETRLYLENNDSIGRRFSWRRLKAGLGIFFSFHSFRAIESILRQYKPDVVHFHSVLPLISPAGFLACKLRGIPTVQTLHNYRWLCVEGGFFRNNSVCRDCVNKTILCGLYYACAKQSLVVSVLLTLVNLLYIKTGLLFKLVDRFIAVSHFVKDQHVAAGFPEGKIIVRYNSVFFPAATRQAAAPQQRNGLIFIGRLAPAKGIAILKEVINRLNAQIPITIIGDGPESDALIHFCRQAGIKNVAFLGKMEKNQIISVLLQAVCVIIPSQVAETCSMVALEAMACGTPIVASALGGLREIVEASGCGICVAPDHADGYVEAIGRIAGSPSLQQKMGNDGKDFISRQCLSAGSQNKLINIYAALIKKRGFAAADGVPS